MAGKRIALFTMDSSHLDFEAKKFIKGYESLSIMVSHE